MIETLAINEAVAQLDDFGQVISFFNAEGAHKGHYMKATPGWERGALFPPVGRRGVNVWCTKDDYFAFVARDGSVTETPRRHTETA